MQYKGWQNSNVNVSQDGLAYELTITLKFYNNFGLNSIKCTLVKTASMSAVLK